MLSSSALRSPATPHAAAAKRTAVVRARVRNYDSIPKREPFTTRRSILDQFLKEKPLVERTKDQMTDYCTTLEGDDCCSCWDAYFEINKLEKELPKGELERMVKEAEGDMRYLIDSVHHRAHLRKMVAETAHSSASSSSQGQTAKPRPFPVPDGLPKTQEELEEEAEALMPESPYTRLLRRMGRYPDWYTPRPDHETD